MYNPWFTPCSDGGALELDQHGHEDARCAAQNHWGRLPAATVRQLRLFQASTHGAATQQKG